MKQLVKQTCWRRCATVVLFLLLCLPFCMAQAQTVKVTGKVIDDLSEPMIGVNVVEKGTTNGCLTDIDGNYTLTVTKGSTLVYSYIGYITEERTAKEGTLNVR